MISLVSVVRHGSTRIGSTMRSSPAVPSWSSVVPRSSRLPGMPGWHSGLHFCSGLSGALPGAWHTLGNQRCRFQRLLTSSGCSGTRSSSSGSSTSSVSGPSTRQLHRWMDGIAVTLVALAAGFALVVQPAAEHKTVGILAAVVAFSYPVLDVLLIGAVLGVYGLLAWRPDTMWILVGLAVVSTSVADAVFAVQEAQARAVISDNRYEFVWTVGALLLALAAWTRAPHAETNPVAVTGMRAVALALTAEALAIGIQIYAIFREIGRSEREPPRLWYFWWLPCRSS